MFNSGIEQSIAQLKEKCWFSRWLVQRKKEKRAVTRKQQLAVTAVLVGLNIHIEMIDC